MFVSYSVIDSVFNFIGWGLCILSLNGCVVRAGWAYKRTRPAS